MCLELGETTGQISLKNRTPPPRMWGSVFVVVSNVMNRRSVEYTTPQLVFL